MVKHLLPSVTTSYHPYQRYQSTMFLRGHHRASTHTSRMVKHLLPALSQSGEISPDFCRSYGGGIRHNENIMHSFQNFIVHPIPHHPPPLETRIWKLVVRALSITVRHYLLPSVPSVPINNVLEGPPSE